MGLDYIIIDGLNELYCIWVVLLEVGVGTHDDDWPRLYTVSAISTRISTSNVYRTNVQYTSVQRCLMSLRTMMPNVPLHAESTRRTTWPLNIRISRRLARDRKKPKNHQWTIVRTHFPFKNFGTSAKRPTNSWACTPAGKWPSLC